MRQKWGTTTTLRQVMTEALRMKGRGEGEPERQEKEEEDAGQDTDEEGWDVTSEGATWNTG